MRRFYSTIVDCPLVNYQSDSYSSTAAYAVTRSTMGILNHSFLMLFYQL